MLLIGCHREALYHKNLKWLNLRKSPSALFLPASSNVLHMHRYFIIRLNWILTQTRENPPQNFKDWAARLENTAVFHKSFSEMLILFSGRQKREEIEFVYQWILVFLLLIYLPFPVLPLAYLSHTAPFLYFPSPPSTTSSSPLFLLSLLLLLFFPHYPTDLYWAVCLRSPLGQWMFKILASCNLSIIRFRPAWLPTTGGHKETFIFCWPFWIFYKTSDCQLNTPRPFDPPAPKSQHGSSRWNILMWLWCTDRTFVMRRVRDFFWSLLAWIYLKVCCKKNVLLYMSHVFDDLPT